MPQTVTLQEAEENPHSVLQRVIAGEEIVISEGGHPVVIMMPAPRNGSPRTPGGAEGRIVVPADFNAPLPDDILRAFEG